MGSASEQVEQKRLKLFQATIAQAQRCDSISNLLNILKHIQKNSNIDDAVKQFEAQLAGEQSKLDDLRAQQKKTKHGNGTQQVFIKSGEETKCAA